MRKKASVEATVRNIRPQTQRITAEDKIRFVLESLRGDHTVAGSIMCPNWSRSNCDNRNI